MTLKVGYHFLEDSYGGPTLPSATFLDPNEWGETRGHVVGMRSQERLCRPYFKGRPNNAEFASKARNWGAQGCRVVFGNEPNHPIEEWNGDPASYRAAFTEVKRLAPSVRLYWAAPSPGFSGWQQWYQGAELADGITVHTYGNLGEMQSVVNHVLATFPSKPLWISEVNFAAGRSVNRDAWARDHLKPFLDWCAQFPAIEAVSYFAYIWPNPDMTLPTPVNAAGTSIVATLQNWRPPAPPTPPPTPPPAPGGTVTEQLKAELARRFGSNFEDLRATLPKHKKWDEDPDYRYRRRNASSIRGHIFHHSESSRATTWQSVAAFHIGPSRDWPGIAYTIGVRYYAGAVKVSLLNDLETISYHVGDNNDIFDAICTMGSFVNEQPTEAELAALREVVAALDVVLGVLPLEPHHRYRPTTCPGKIAGHLASMRVTAPLRDWKKTAYWVEEAARKARTAGDVLAHDTIVSEVLPYIYDRRSASDEKRDR